MAVFRGLFVRKDATRGTQPAEARKALAGLLVPSSVVGARQGILAAPGDPLKVTGTAGWTYQVNGGHLASSRGDTDGVVLFGNDGAANTPAVAAAPGSGSRWDLIYLRHEDVDKGGGETSAATLGVVSGVASGTPVKPTLPAGAVLVAEALVSAGATSTNHANVTITHKLGRTAARGGLVPVANQAERDALVGYSGLAVIREDTGNIEKWRPGNTWDVFSPDAPNTMPSGSGALVGTYTGQPLRAIGGYGSFPTNGSGDTTGTGIALPAGVSGVKSATAVGAGASAFNITAFFYVGPTSTVASLYARVYNGGVAIASGTPTLSWQALVW